MIKGNDIVLLDKIKANLFTIQGFIDKGKQYILEKMQENKRRFEKAYNNVVQTVDKLE